MWSQPAFPHPWIETERLGFANFDIPEVTMIRIDDEVAFVRNHHGRHGKDGSCSTLKPAITDHRQCGWRRVRAPLGRQVTDGNGFDCDA